MKHKDIIEKINNLRIGDAVCQRVSEYTIEGKEGYILYDVWQCNMAELGNISIKLPTALQIQTDSEGIIKEIELLENFKGSQGIPCSRAYLNRRMKERVMMTSLADKRMYIRHKRDCDCRHINELLCGTSTLLSHMKSQNLHHCNVYNVTLAKEMDFGMLTYDEILYQDMRVISRIEFHFDKSAIRMGQDGRIKEIGFMEVSAEIISNDESIVKTAVLESVDTNQDFIMAFLKLMHETWRMVGTYLSVSQDFCFSNLYPPSYYGLFVQCLSLILYPDNYNYFQHSVAGLQRRNGKPLCIGMVETIEEAERVFPSFRFEDLYEL